MLHTHTAALAIAASIAATALASPVDRIDFAPGAINIDFDTFPDASPVPSGTLIDTQYQTVGAEFISETAPPTADGSASGFYGPLASGNILAAGSDFAGFTITVSFVDTMTFDPTTTNAVGADIIFVETNLNATLEVFDIDGLSLGSIASPIDQGAGDEYFLGYEAAGIASAVFTFSENESFAGIDNLVFGDLIPAPGATALLALAALTTTRRRRA